MKSVPKISILKMAMLVWRRLLPISQTFCMFTPFYAALSQLKLIFIKYFYKATSYKKKVRAIQTLFLILLNSAAICGKKIFIEKRTCNIYLQNYNYYNADQNHFWNSLQCSARFMNMNDLQTARIIFKYRLICFVFALYEPK